MVMKLIDLRYRRSFNNFTSFRCLIHFMFQIKLMSQLIPALAPFVSSLIVDFHLLLECVERNEFIN